MKKLLLLVGLALAAIPALAQDSRTVQGIVVDDTGVSLHGAAVSLKGTLQGTSTDASGRFSMRVPSTGEVFLEVEFLGYEKKTVEVGRRSDFRVVLVPQALTTGEVVITGLGNIDKSDYVGAITQISADKLKIAGESSIDQMLQGVVPGMSVVNVTGKVGATPKIRIRGTSTLLGNKEPLWVVDGVVQTNPMPPIDPSSPIAQDMESLMETAGNAISWLNPADIETITVLKDASATAIYGSQASNGVIVVTTKKAQGAGLSVSYSGDFTVGQRPRYSHYDMMNSQELMQFHQEMFLDKDRYASSLAPVGYAKLLDQWWKGQISGQQYEAEFHKLEMENTDWFKHLFRNSFSQKHNVSISGVGDKVHSRFSVGLDRQSGEARGNNLHGLTAASSTTFRIDDRFIVDLNLNGSYREVEDFAFGVSPYNYAMETSRTIPIYNEDGTLYYHLKEGQASYSVSDPNFDTSQGNRWYNYNILNELDNTGARTTNMNVNTSLNVTVKLLEGLEFRGMASYVMGESRMKSWATEFSHYIAANHRRYEYGQVAPNSSEERHSPLPKGGLLRTQNAETNNYAFRGSLNYNKTFNDLHRVMVQLGAEATSNSLNGFGTDRYGYRYYRGETFSGINSRESIQALDALGNTLGFNTNYEDLNEKMRAATSVTDTRDNKTSQYMTAIYGYNERYILNFNARLDASNRFGQDHNKKFNPSWSIGAKWRVGNEEWMEWSKEWMNMFDISMSYGFRGNAVQQVSPYLIATMGTNPQFSSDILTIRSLAYPGLGWERKNDWNLSFDFSFLDNRLTAVLNLYGSKADVLSSYSVPVDNGVGSAYVEGTKMTNNGWDLDVNFVPIRTDDWTWSLSLNSGRVNNTVKNNNVRVDYNSYISGAATVDGEEYGTFYAYKYAGLDPQTGRPLIDKVNHNRIADTEYDLDFLVRAGCLEPDFSGGVNTNVRYKNWSLGMALAVSLGADKFLPDVWGKEGAPTPDKNAPRYLMDRWRKPGDEQRTDIPSVPPGDGQDAEVQLPILQTAQRNSSYFESTYTMYNRSDIRVASSDFIRCRNISLRYDLPASVLDKINARRVTLSASMSNPFVIAFDNKWDGRDPETGGWPARRTTSFSLSLAF